MQEEGWLIEVTLKQIRSHSVQSPPPPSTPLDSILGFPPIGFPPPLLCNANECTGLLTKLTNYFT